MHKVTFIKPCPIDRRNNGASCKIEDYTAERVSGWSLEMEPEALVFAKDERELWYAADPITGWRISNWYATRKEAMKDASMWSNALHVYKEGNKEHYRELADLNAALMVELHKIENGVF